MSASHDEAHADAPAGLKVLATSTVHPRVRTVQVSRPEPQDVSFLAATAKGLGVTLKHFARNFFLPMKKLSDRNKAGAPVDETWRNEIETVQYPEEKVIYPERFRGLHRLTLREDGAVRCVACMCCPTVCPAHCITIIPAETDDKGIEKKPAVFEIDELRCVVCGREARRGSRERDRDQGHDDGARHPLDGNAGWRRTELARGRWWFYEERRPSLSAVSRSLQAESFIRRSDPLSIFSIDGSDRDP
jgi:ferredoxin